MAATIINIAIFLKYNLGVNETNAGLSETSWSCVMIYVALFIYILASYMERNPVFGGVYLWVLLALRTRQKASDI